MTFSVKIWFSVVFTSIRFWFQSFPFNIFQFRWIFLCFHLFCYFFNQSSLIIHLSTFLCGLSSSYLFCTSVLGSSVFSPSLLFLWISSSYNSESQPFVLITLFWAATLFSVTSNNPISLQIFIIVHFVETFHGNLIYLFCPSHSGNVAVVFSFYLICFIT